MQADAQVLGTTDINILGQVAVAMANFNAPMLLDKQHWDQAAQMADRGLLQRHEALFGSYGYTLTEAGVAAYRSVMPPAQGPLVKAWGETVPTTQEAKRAFIKSQATPIGQAKYLEYTSGEGAAAETVSFTLSEEALVAKRDELGFKGWHDDDSRERFNIGDEDSYSFYLCDVTGKLLDGNWSEDPSAMIYFMSGFAWRRESGFQMEDRDWQEVSGYLDRLGYDEDAAELVRILCESCFLEPRGHNDTGMYNPGGPCTGDMSDLISLFDFMREKDKQTIPDRPRG